MNKNEWHKQEVDDIYDFISEDWSVRHFICIMKDKSRVTAIGNCDEGLNGEVGVNLFFEHNDDKYYLDDIVLWKEIELPTTRTKGAEKGIKMFEKEAEEYQTEKHSPEEIEQ